MMTGKMGDRDSPEEIRRVFKLFDDDETGRISFRNLKRVARELGENMTDEELQEMINKADLDGDGEVNEEEFMRIMVIQLSSSPRCPRDDARASRWRGLSLRARIPRATDLQALVQGRRQVSSGATCRWVERHPIRVRGRRTEPLCRHSWRACACAHSSLCVGAQGSRWRAPQSREVACAHPGALMEDRSPTSDGAGDAGVPHV